jgi:hypothetical protein
VSELCGREIEADRPRSPAGERDRPASCSATDLEDVAAPRVAERQQLGFREAPEAPRHGLATAQDLTMPPIVPVALALPQCEVLPDVITGSPAARTSRPGSGCSRPGPTGHLSTGYPRLHQLRARKCWPTAAGLGVQPPLNVWASPFPAEEPTPGSTLRGWSPVGSRRRCQN